MIRVEPTEERQKVLHVYVTTRGIKGRDRKSKLHVDDIGDFALEGFDKEAAKQVGIDWLSRNMKAVEQSYMTLAPAEVQREDGFIVRSIRLMTGEKIALA